MRCEGEQRANLQQGLAGDYPWWLIHSRPRCEKRMAAWLEGEGFKNELPLRQKVRVYPGKRVVFSHPIFPGYVFGAFPMEARAKVYASGHAAAIRAVVDQARLLRDLEGLRRALASGLDLEVSPYLSIGQRVRITAGRLRGVEGRVVRQAGRTRLILSVELLQQAVAVEIDPEWVTPCS